jgi:inhibitor of cysteine peptidase
MKKTTYLIMILAIVCIVVAGCQQAVPINNGNPGQQNIPQIQNGGNSNVQGNTNVQLNQGTYTNLASFDPQAEIATKSFASMDEYSNFVKAHYNSNSNYYYGDGIALRDGITMEKTASAVAAPMAAGGAGADQNVFSNTNNQVDLVDEGDIIKTDGNNIYTISGSTVFIIKAYPGEDAKITATMKYKDYPQGLFINGNYLAVYGQFTDIDFFKDMNFRPTQGMSFFNIYDISDKANPELVKEYKFEGNFFQARMNGDFVYFVTTSGLSYRKDYPTPLMLEGTTIRSMPVRDIYYFPIPYQSVQFANIHSIDLKKPESDVKSKSVAVESSQNMYMSEDNIYITYTEYINEYELMQKITTDLVMPRISDSDKELIAKIKATDNDVLNQQEKESKIYQIIQSYVQFMTSDDQTSLQDHVENKTAEELDKYDYMEYTVINKVGVDNGEISVKANGKAPGHVLNQFSMDEKDNVLRIATTVSQRWSSFRNVKMAAETASTESQNIVTTLDKDLKVLDSLKGLAPGEQIFSTRFMDNRLYMVTYKQVDPFFVIDLKDPTDIKQLGALKIPGFSRYLHPYDENTIIGIGRDTSSVTGQTRGLKISLFDVSNVEKPKEIAKFVTNEQYAQSNAEYEHKAFLFSKAKNLLVIPAYSYSYTYYDNGMPRREDSYNGAMVFNITKDEIELRGIIDHSMGTSSYNYYSPTVERSLYINDMLYTKSPNLLRINKLSDLSKVKNLELEGTTSAYKIY